jgi:acyl carrier protein
MHEGHQTRSLVVNRSDEVRQFVVDNYLFGEDTGLTEETSFREENILDSTGILELISFLEETYDIAIEDNELIPDNLDSLRRIVAFVEHKTRHESIEA